MRLVEDQVERLVMIRVLDSAGSTLVEWGRQQQQQRLVMVLAYRAKSDASDYYIKS